MKYLAVGWVVLIGLPGVTLLLGFLWVWGTRRRRWITQFVRAATWYGWALAYIGFWLLYGVASWLVVLSIAPDLAISSAPDVVVSATIAWLAGFLVVLVPGGLGIREGVWALTLTPIVGAGGGVFVPLVARGIGMLAEATFSILCFFCFRAEITPNNPKEVLS